MLLQASDLAFIASAIPAMAGLAVLAGGDGSPSSPPATPPFKLEPLPYREDALEPYISARTIGFHYGKHHQTYVDNLNKLAGTEFAGVPLERIVRETAGVAGKESIFNNAAQVANHDAFWRSMRPGGGGDPKGKLLERIDRSFGSFDKFRDAFLAAALAQFGSGWTWLVEDGEALSIVRTSNAETPEGAGKRVLIVCDVWEHAYYLDYQNRRKDFVEAFLLHLVDWDAAARRMK